MFLTYFTSSVPRQGERQGAGGMEAGKVGDMVTASSRSASAVPLYVAPHKAGRAMSAIPATAV